MCMKHAVAAVTSISTVMNAGGVTTSDAKTNGKVYPNDPGVTPDRILAGEVRAC